MIMMERAPRLTWLGCVALGIGAACAPDPSLDDPYAANGYMWPYEVADGAEATSVCPPDLEASLGTIDGAPVLALNDCEIGSEGEFALCAAFVDEGRLQIRWDGVNGFALFVTEPDAVVPVAPNTPVSGGETFWAIGPEAFPSDGFASPLDYGVLAAGTVDVTVDHAGPAGGSALEAGRCYKITLINNGFQRASLIMGWE